MSTDPAAPAYTHILVATDGSTHAQVAVVHAARLAARLGTHLTILTVVEPLHSLGARSQAFWHLPEAARQQALDLLTSDARAILDHAVAVAQDAGVSAAVSLAEGEPVAETIVAAARSAGADLVVIGSHGRTGLAAIVVGSVARHVLTLSSVPVLIVR